MAQGCPLQKQPACSLGHPYFSQLCLELPSLPGALYLRASQQVPRAIICITFHSVARCLGSCFVA